MKKQHYMTEQERYQLEALRRARVPVIKIAEILGCTRQTVYNELKRGMWLHTIDYRDVPEYSAVKGQNIHERAVRNKGREKKALRDPEYLTFLERKILREKYSPAAALVEARKAGYQTTVCVATLYSYIDSGVFRHLGNIHLLEKVRRKPRNKNKVKIAHVQLPSIEQRPSWILERSELGHWEMDLVVGCRGSRSCLLTLTERRSRRELIFKLPDKKAASVRKVFDRMERELGKQRFRETFRSVTTDNGSEFMEYEDLRKSIYQGYRFQIWYCHSYAAWEKGTNENHNRIIRRFFPKGTNFDQIPARRIREVQDWMNNYPRRKLGWRTPNEVA